MSESPPALHDTTTRARANPLRCLILAGEVSGDLHAAALMRALQAQWPHPIDFRGMGGDAMRAAGATLRYHTDQTAVMGVWEVVRHYGFFQRMMRAFEAELVTWQPNLVLTIDYPGFNLRFAARAHARGFITVHYICPQVWAWHRSRIPRIAAMLDHLITLFPFEPELFRDTGLRVTFAGHPLVDRASETWNEPAAALPWSAARRVALLPGSRAAEITRILPDLLAAAAQLDRDPGDCSVLIPTPTRAMRELAEQVTRQAPVKPQRLAFVDGQARQVLRQAHVAAVASGTATLEASLMRCPTVLVYRTNLPTYLLARLLVRGVRHLGLANIVAKREIMPELLQGQLTPTALAAHLRRLLTDEAARRAMDEAMEAVNRSLGEGQAAERAAAAVLATLRQT